MGGFLPSPPSFSSSSFGMLDEDPICPLLPSSPLPSLAS